MPKGSEELTKERENEIIDACKKLYRTMSFKEITYQGNRKNHIVYKNFDL